MKPQSVTVARTSQPALEELIAELLKTLLPDADNKTFFIDETPSKLTLSTDFHCFPHLEERIWSPSYGH